MEVNKIYSICNQEKEGCTPLGVYFLSGEYFLFYRF